MCVCMGVYIWCGVGLVWLGLEVDVCRLYGQSLVGYMATLLSEFIIGSEGDLSWCYRLIAWVRPRDKTPWAGCRSS